MKISGTVEQLFAGAVALDQNGGMRNTVYALANKIFVLNYDHSMLLRFRLRKTETPFHSPVAFRANDYDSNEFYEENGKIVFVSTTGGYQKKKSCGVPDFTPAQIDTIFKKYAEECTGIEVTISKDILPLLDSELSHIEFVGQKGQPIKLIQRNIYSGTILEVQESKGFLSTALEKGIEPVAITTNNFSALFLFANSLKFTFLPNGQEGCIIVRSVDQQRRDMMGVIAPCLYDEIIELKKVPTKED